MKTPLFLLNLRVNYPADPPLEYPWINFTSEAEEYDPPIARAPPLVPILKKMDHHAVCQLSDIAPQYPRHVAVMLIWLPHNIQSLKEL